MQLGYRLQQIAAAVENKVTDLWQRKHSTVPRQSQVGSGGGGRLNWEQDAFLLGGRVGVNFICLFAKNQTIEVWCCLVTKVLGSLQLTDSRQTWTETTVSPSIFFNFFFNKETFTGNRNQLVHSQPIWSGERGLLCHCFPFEVNFIKRYLLHLLCFSLLFTCFICVCVYGCVCAGANACFISAFWYKVFR